MSLKNIAKKYKITYCVVSVHVLAVADCGSADFGFPTGS